MQSIKQFLDEEGKVRQLPVRRGARVAVLRYLYEQIEDRDYTEREISALLSSLHTFNDYFLVRRELVDEGFLLRVPDGSRYWKNPDALGSEEN
ncbi:MAG: DUF2087 domain-containing protein [Bacillota bacterium]